MQSSAFKINLHPYREVQNVVPTRSAAMLAKQWNLIGKVAPNIEAKMKASIVSLPPSTKRRQDRIS